MSLAAMQSAVTELVAARQALVDVNSRTDQLLASYNARLGNLLWTAWVDGAAGNDANSGRTREAPLRTLRRVAELTPRGGFVRVHLLNDVTLNNDVVLNQIHMEIQHDPLTPGAVTTPAARRKITLVEVERAGFAGMTGFHGSGYGSVSMFGVELVIPAQTSPFAALSVHPQRCAFTPFWAPSGIMMAAALQSSSISLPTTPAGCLLWYSPSQLHLETVTMTGARSSLNGFVVHGVTNTSGTPAKDVPHLLINIPTV